MNARIANCNGKEVELSSDSQPINGKSPQPPSWKGEQEATSAPRRVDWIEEINRYLPISFANRDEETYIDSLRETFELNYSNRKYEFAHFAFHLLYMSFAACTVWKIRHTREADFCKALIGFKRDRENCILRSDSPFMLLDNIREANVFRFLKLIGCDNIHVGGFARFTNRRNQIAHPKGSLFIDHPNTLDSHISGILKEAENIQEHMHQIVEELFDQHSENKQIEAIVRENYLSARDMESF